MESATACSRNIADAPKVAPLQPWALGLYEHRQQRQLRDDPVFLNCKPPGGVRYLQSPFGLQFVEDDERQRIFVLIGGGNHNYRIIYMDGREQKGQVDGDDDNPLYYGRAVGRWDGDTLIVDHRLQRRLLVHERRLAAHRQAALDGAFLASRLRHAALRGHRRRSGRVHAPWSSGWELHWVGGEELPVYFCQDNRS